LPDVRLNPIKGFRCFLEQITQYWLSVPEAGSRVI